MSDEDLEVLITLDDPWYGPDEDTFHHLQPDAVTSAAAMIQRINTQESTSIQPIIP